MNEIENYKKRRKIFQICSCVSSIAVLIYLVAVLLSNNTFNIYCIIAVSVFGAYTLLILTMFAVFDLRRNFLVKKYFGKVSDQDKEISKSLLKKVDSVKKCSYSFLEESTYDLKTKVITPNLKRISKGYKVCIELTEVIFEIQLQIEISPEKNLEENIEFNNYFKELTMLFDRNKSDI